MINKLVRAIEELSHAIRELRDQEALRRIERKVDQIMATQKEMADDLKLVHAQQVKTAGEIALLQEAQNVAITKIAELEALIAAGGTVTQELVDAVAAVKTQAQIVDDLIPDVVPPPVEPAP